MTKREKMFQIIGRAVVTLKVKGNMSEDAATTIILDGMKALPAESVMDLALLPTLLESIIELELSFINQTK
jgi:hypothetical protein